MHNKFSVIKDGQIYEYEIIKLCKNNGINYIIYKDLKDYYGSRYSIINEKIVLDEIIDEKEWDFIDDCLGDINE